MIVIHIGHDHFKTFQIRRAPTIPSFDVTRGDAKVTRHTLPLASRAICTTLCILSNRQNRYTNHKQFTLSRTIPRASTVTAIHSRSRCRRGHVLGTVFIFKFFFFWRNSPQWARASSFTRFLYHTQRRTTVVRTPLDE